MHKRTSILTCFVALLFAGHAWASTPVFIPDWVTAAAALPPATYPPRTNAVVLFDDTTISVNGPGSYVETYRRVERILRPEGRDEGIVSLYLRKGDKLTNLHAWSIDSAGHKYEVKNKEFLQSSPFDGELYSDIQLLATKVPAADTGTIVAFEYTVERNASTNQLRWYFQGKLPVVETSFSLTLPQGFQYKAWWTNHAAEQPASAGSSTWKWSENNIPAITNEDYRPVSQAIAGRMDLAYFTSTDETTPHFASWENIGVWYNTLTEGRRSVTPQISDKVRQLTANTSGFDATVRAIAHYMQTQVRYVAVEIGIGGYQPHSAADVFRYSYGDCKDKVTLMSAMLSVVNIPSHYVLIDSDHGVVQPNAPTTSFDHAILAIDIPSSITETYRSAITAPDGKRYLIFDPTDSYTPLGELSEDLQGNYGLLVAGGKGESIQLPLLPPGATQLDRDGKFTLAADGTLTGQVTEQRTGRYAWIRRSEMMNANDSDRTRLMENYLNTFLTGMTLQSSSMEHLSDISQPLVFHYAVTSPQYAQNSGPMLIVRPRVLGQKYLSIEWKDRKYPVYMGGTSDETDTFDVTIPDGYKVDDVPDATKLDVGFASYTSGVTVNGTTLHYHREYIVKQPLVGPDHFTDLHRLEDAIARDESASVILMKK